MSHRKSDLGIPCPRKICQSSARACTHKIATDWRSSGDARFAPDSGANADIAGGPRSATSRHMQRSKFAPLSAAFWTLELAVGAARQAHRKHRALARLARNRDVAAHHLAEPPA